jgi:RimJ/RimL family protein N-acetyltransferase
MITLTSADVTQEILARFDREQPTMPRALAVLAGITRGEILADDPVRPTWAAVRESNYGTLYLGGRITAPLVAALVERLREHGDVGIGCWPESPLAAVLPPNPQYDGRTLYFPTRSTEAALAPFLGSLPPGYTLVLRDKQLFARSFDAADTLAAFGTMEQVMRHTRGVMILHGDRVVCEAATGAPVEGRIEVGVTTDEQHRGKGLATAACAALIAACEAEGLATWWDCGVQNEPSIRLARRLGFRAGREYRYLLWPKR